MVNLILAAVIAVVLIGIQYYEIQKEKKLVKHWKKQWWIVAREQVQLEKEMKLLRKANGEMYSSGFNDGQVASIRKMGESLIDGAGKLHIKM